MADNIFLAVIGLAIVGATVATGNLDWQTIGIVTMIMVAIGAHITMRALDS